MGTYIHGRLEEKNAEGEWVEIDDSFAVTRNRVLKLPHLRRSYVSKRRQKKQAKYKRSYFNRDSIAFFDFQSYGIYGWLANVRNYSAVPSLKPETVYIDDEYDVGGYGWAGDAEPRKIPVSALSAKTLIEFDYSQLVEDRRSAALNAMRDTVDAGHGKVSTYRTFLGRSWMARVAFLKNHPECRLVFWFN